MQLRVIAQQDNFKLEVERHWETYGVGGTCIYGTHNLVVADVDGDGIKEMITGGFSYDMVNGTPTSYRSPFKIWRWDGQNLILLANRSWPGTIWCVYAGDADGDGKTEIITAGGNIGSAGISEGITPWLKFWNWNDQTLTLRGSYEGVSGTSIFVGDVDKDDKPEVVTVGRSFTLNSSGAVGQMKIWRWGETNFVFLNDVEWRTGSDASANSVTATDLNNDGQMEIITAGYDNGLKNSSGQLRVWQLNGTDVILKSNAEWRMLNGVYGVDVAGNPMGNTLVNNVKVADVDGDGVSEIVTGGFTYEDDKFEGQLRIWNWTGGVLNLEKSQEWTTLDITELKSISINDVDGDGKTEIVTSGVTAVKGSFSENAANKELAELKVWSWDGNTLTLKQSKDWNVGQGVCAWNVGTGDVDNDGTAEITTVGCMYENTLCDPDMRIWSIAKDLSPSPYALLAAVVIAVSAIALAVVILLVRKKRQ